MIDKEVTAKRLEVINARIKDVLSILALLKSLKEKPNVKD